MFELIRAVVTIFFSLQKKYFFFSPFVCSFISAKENPNDSHLAMMAHKNEFIGFTLLKSKTCC